MASYLTSIVLEFAEEDLSDTTPTWVDVTSDLIEAEWWAGVAKEGNDPDAGGARLVMRNRNRRWEPDYVAGQFYPNVTTHRRFRLTLDDTAGSPIQEGVWYVADIALEYPGDGDVSLATFTCADGVEVLALDSLPLLDPPDADSYEDVVSHDEPLAYFGLADPPGTNVRRMFKTVRRGKRKNRRKIRKPIGERVIHPLAAGGGSDGRYVDPANNAHFQRESVILGSRDGAFDAESSAYAQASVEREAFYEVNAVTIEQWRRCEAGAGIHAAGPWRAAVSRNIFQFDTGSNGRFQLDLTTGLVQLNNAGGAHSLGDIVHYVGTWDGQTACFYINGVLQESATPGGRLQQGDANEYVYPVGGGHSQGTAAGEFAATAFYEHALTAERVLAHYQAGAARGWEQQTAGARIADITTHALWSEANIQTIGRDVTAEFKTGQAKLEEIGELARAEGPRTMFWFDGDGDPVYLGHEWKASSASFNTVQAVFGDGVGEIRPQTIEGPVLDNEVYNETTVTHEAGEAVTVGDGTPAPRRENTEYTDVLLHEHVHVESLAYDLAAFYQDPQWRPLSVTLNGANPSALHHILRRDIGHLIRVKRRGEGGTPIDRVANIIAKRKHLSSDRHLTCVWTLSRGFNAAPATGGWHAGIAGFSEAGSTTVAA